jgi:DnaJ family protein A protein 2
MRGNLYIQYQVEFPESGAFTLEQCKQLEVVLPPKPANQIVGIDLNECEETIPYDVNMDEEMRRKQQQQQQQRAEAYDEDDDVHMGGGQRVQCAQQ